MPFQPQPSTQPGPEQKQPEALPGPGDTMPLPQERPWRSFGFHHTHEGTRECCCYLARTTEATLSTGTLQGRWLLSLAPFMTIKNTTADLQQLFPIVSDLASDSRLATAAQLFAWAYQRSLPFSHPCHSTTLPSCLLKPLSPYMAL